MFIFHITNPTALQDDFWKTFINIATFSVSLISQIIHMVIPGKKPHNFFVCLGHFPVKLTGIPVKSNEAVNYLLLLSFLLHMFGGIRIMIYRFRENQMDLMQSVAAVSTLSSEAMINFTTNAISLLIFIASAVVPVVINTTDPANFQVYPNYIWLYVMHHYSPTVVLGSTAIIYYTKNPPIRDYAWSEIVRIFGWMATIFPRIKFNRVSPAIAQVETLP